MKKAEFLELMNQLTENEINLIIGGINQITFEYGWDKDGIFDEHPVILELWNRRNEE